MVDARAPRALEWFGALVAALGLALMVAAPAATAPRSTVAAPAAAFRLGPTQLSPGTESDFVGRINSLRASKGLSQLQVSGDLVGVARRWTEQMQAAGQISHNPNLGSQVPGAWTKLGENVGVGYDVGGLMQAFIDSPAHYRNLVDPEWTHIGVGAIVEADGRIWTTHNFMALGSAPPPPPPTTAPPRAAPPTTAPPAQSPEDAPVTTTTGPAPAPTPPTPERVRALLDPLRSLEG